MLVISMLPNKSRTPTSLDFSSGFHPERAFLERKAQHWLENQLSDYSSLIVQNVAVWDMTNSGSVYLRKGSTGTKLWYVRNCHALFLIHIMWIAQYAKDVPEFIKGCMEKKVGAVCHYKCDHASHWLSGSYRLVVVKCGCCANRLPRTRNSHSIIQAHEGEGAFMLDARYVLWVQ